MAEGVKLLSGRPEGSNCRRQCPSAVSGSVDRASSDADRWRCRRSVPPRYWMNGSGAVRESVRLFKMLMVLRPARVRHRDPASAGGDSCHRR